MTGGPGETDANAAPAAKPPACSCPRCAYDLSGHTSTWTNAWPLEGRCSECGLTFEWRDVMDPRRRRLRWFYEHSPWWRFDKAFGTALRALAPWSFWRRVTVECEVKPSRLAPFPWVAWLCVHAMLAAILVGGVAALAHFAPFNYGNRPGWFSKQFSPDAQTYIALAADDLLPFRREFLSNPMRVRIASSDVAPFLCAFLGWSLTVTAVLLATPSEWRTVRVRPVLVARIGVYSLSPALIFVPTLGFLFALKQNEWITAEIIARVGMPPQTFQAVGSAMSHLPRMAHYLFGAALLWMPFSLWYALRRGIRLSSIWRLYPLLVVVGLLGAIAIGISLGNRWS